MVEAGLLSKHNTGRTHTRSVREVAKGYFHDYHVLRHHGGKTWIAPNTLIRDDVRSISFDPTLLLDVHAERVVLIETRNKTGGEVLP